jgi:Holliday junction resolvasome RuvABC endonuclease subunit
MLALDPSFTATGWVAVDLLRETIIAAGVITTAKAKATEKLTGAQDDARRGLAIRRALLTVCRTYAPVVMAQEGASGSKSARAASALARAQQVAVDVADEVLGVMPIIVTQQAVKITALGRHTNTTKSDLKSAAERRWPGADFPAMLTASITPEPAPSEWENAYDAACVAACVWDHPAVVLARKLGA